MTETPKHHLLISDTASDCFIRWMVNVSWLTWAVTLGFVSLKLFGYYSSISWWTLAGSMLSPLVFVVAILLYIAVRVTVIILKEFWLVKKGQ